MRGLFGACVVAAVLAGASPAWAQDASKSAVGGDTANGRKLYDVDGCYQCHGHAGQGGAMNGLAPILAQTGMPYEAFRRQVRNPVNDMPAYPVDLLPEKDLADIYAFVRSLPGRRPVKDFPLLSE